MCPFSNSFSRINIKPISHFVLSLLYLYVARSQVVVVPRLSLNTLRLSPFRPRHISPSFFPNNGRKYRAIRWYFIEVGDILNLGILMLEKSKLVNFQN